MPHVNELATEIVSAIEVYFLGRDTQQYNNAAFILCDDYTELAAKLFLITDDKSWSGADTDKQKEYDEALKEVLQAAQNATTAHTRFVTIIANGSPKDSFKNYHKVLDDVQKVFSNKRSSEATRLETFHNLMRERRKTRNNVFHSPDPLGTKISSQMCVEALDDLLAYVKLLFGLEWEKAAKWARRLETYALLLTLERQVHSDPAIRQKINGIFQRRRRQNTASQKHGVELLTSGQDVYTYLCIWLDSDHSLKYALQALKSEVCKDSTTP